jgi:hypothetical protein
MQNEYLSLLPNDLKEIVEATEQVIGFPIDVVVDPTRARGVPGEADPLACLVDLASARLLIPSADWFPPGSVFHELMHIQRFLVEGIPRITDCEDFEQWTPAMGTALTMHDNCIEHLVIVPKELHRFPDRREHWEGVMARAWAGIAEEEGSELDRRQGALAHWTFLQLVLPTSSSVAVARDALGALGLQERANQLCEALFPVLGDKAAAVRVWFTHLDIPLEIAALEYVAPQDGRTWEVPLANAG